MDEATYRKLCDAIADGRLVAIDELRRAYARLNGVAVPKIDGRTVRRLVLATDRCEYCSERSYKCGGRCVSCGVRRAETSARLRPALARPCEDYDVAGIWGVSDDDEPAASTVPMQDKTNSEAVDLYTMLDGYGRRDYLSAWRGFRAEAARPEARAVARAAGLPILYGRLYDGTRRGHARALVRAGLARWLDPYTAELAGGPRADPEAPAPELVALGDFCDGLLYRLGRVEFVARRVAAARHRAAELAAAAASLGRRAAAVRAWAARAREARAGDTAAGYGTDDDADPRSDSWSFSWPDSGSDSGPDAGPDSGPGSGPGSGPDSGPGSGPDDSRSDPED